MHEDHDIDHLELGADLAPPPPRERRQKPRRPHLDPSIKQARAKLTQRTHTRPEFEYELLYLFAENNIKASFILPLIGINVAFAALAWTPVGLVAGWYGSLLLANGLLLYLCRRMTTLPRKKVRVGPWRNRLMLAEFVHGLCWGGVALFGLHSPDHRAHMFVFVALILVNSLRMTLANAALRIVFAGTIPVTLALLARFWYLDTPFYWAMASLAVGFHVFFFYLLSHLHTNTLTTVELRAETDALIADLEQATSLSEEGRRRAEAANLAKSRFLATMSHELRTPLNAIIGFSEIMKEEMFGPHSVPTYKTYATDIHGSGQHLLNLINEILDITRIEAGKYDLNEEAVRIADIAEECCNMVKVRAEAKGLTIEQRYEPELERLWADERSIRQICLNLLSNAVKFTPNGGRIIIAAGRLADGGQYLSVRDTGPGIPEEELPRVLSSFGQGSLAHENAEGGTGLGLPIVRGLIKLHGGQFDLKTKLREGTEVLATFPAGRVLQVMPQIPAQPANPAQAAGEASTPTAGKTAAPTTTPAQAAPAQSR